MDDLTTLPRKLAERLCDDFYNYRNGARPDNPTWKREQEIATKFRPALAEIFKLEMALPADDPLRHRLYQVRCELGRIDYDARSKA